MGGGPCFIIIDGNRLQGEAALLSSTAVASCQLVDYLENDDEANFDIKDAQPIQDFHIRAKGVVSRLNAELDKINRELAAKYNRLVY